MKSTNIFLDRSYGYAKSIVALVGGLILVIWPEIIKKYIIFILGACILAVGIISLIMSYAGKWKNEKVPLLLLNSIVDMAFGLVLLIFPTFFSKLLMFVFGITLLVFGLGEIINLIRSSKIVKIPWGLYVGPSITTILGVILFFYPNKSGNWLFIMFGITLLIYAISEFISTFMVRKKIKHLKRNNNHTIKEIAYEEVKDNNVKK